MTDDFDWIKARTDCTVSAVFETLKKDVQDDLARFAQLCPGEAQSRDFGDCGKSRFFVERKQVNRVVFEREKSAIQIGRWEYMGDHTPLMTLTVNLDDDCNCVLTDEDGNAWKPWQVRRKALEGTLF